MCLLRVSYQRYQIFYIICIVVRAFSKEVYVKSTYRRCSTSEKIDRCHAAYIFYYYVYKGICWYYIHTIYMFSSFIVHPLLLPIHLSFIRLSIFFFYVCIYFWLLMIFILYGRYIILILQYHLLSIYIKPHSTHTHICTNNTFSRKYIVSWRWSIKLMCRRRHQISIAMSNYHIFSRYDSLYEKCQGDKETVQTTNFTTY